LHIIDDIPLISNDHPVIQPKCRQDAEWQYCLNSGYPVLKVVQVVQILKVIGSKYSLLYGIPMVGTCLR
jgi:hypothetical protein